MNRKAIFKKISTERIKGTAAIERKITLSAIDHFEVFFFIEIVYFFSETLDAEALKSSLSKVLDLFPILCGQLQKEPNGTLSIQKTTAGVSFTVCECSRELPEPSNDTLSKYNACLFIERLNPFNLTRQNCPLATFKLTRLAGGGCALGISMAHALTDGHGFFNFLRSWSQLHNGQPHTKPFFDRRLVNPEIASLKTFSDSCLDLPERYNGFKYLSLAGLVKFLTKVVFNMNNILTSTTHFTESQLNAIKNEGSKNSRISLNDALSSHLWKCYSSLIGLEGEKKQHLLLPTNIRSLTDHPSAENYFGNAVSHILLEKNACEITGSSVADMAQEWRKTVHEIDNNYVKNQMQWLKRHEERKKLYRVLADINLFNGDLFITNFSKFPVCSVSFNSSKPFRTEIPLIPIPGIFFLLPAPAGKGINLCAHLPKSLTTKLMLEKFHTKLYKYGEL